MSDEKKVHDSGKATYVAPTLTTHGTFENITRQDVDGRRFDLSFNQGDPIPDAFAS